jgi:hypothetical protein
MRPIEEPKDRADGQALWRHFRPAKSRKRSVDTLPWRPPRLAGGRVGQLVRSTY